MSSPYLQASLLGLPGELRNTIHEFVAADVTDVHISPTTEVPFILGSEERMVDETSEWYVHANMTDGIICMYSRGATPPTELFLREVAPKPAPKITMAQHALLHTSRQLRNAFVSILQNRVTRPRGIGAKVVDFDFSHVLTQLGHYSMQDVVITLSKNTRSIKIRLKRGKVSLHEVQQDLHIHRQQVAVRKRSKSRRSNGIYYAVQLQTEHESHVKENDIMGIEALFASHSILVDAKEELGGRSLVSWMGSSGLTGLIFHNEKANVRLLAMLAPAYPEQNTRLRKITSMGRGEAEWVCEELVLKDLLAQFRGSSQSQRKKREYFSCASWRSTNQKRGIHDRRWIG